MTVLHVETSEGSEITDFIYFKNNVNFLVQTDCMGDWIFSVKNKFPHEIET